MIPYATSNSTNVIRFPWQRRELSPNFRIDRRKLNGIKREAREMGYYLAREAFPNKLERMDVWHFVFHPPSYHKNDIDNALSSCKAVLDGMCQWLELDDNLVKRAVLDWGEVQPGNGEIVLFIEPLDGPTDEHPHT